ncbi:MAG: hypothetical protein ACFCU4_10160 [Puniceicoccaceae bacterium]
MGAKESQGQEKIHPKKASYRLLFILVPVVYGALYLLDYSGTPLGLNPVLDGKESLILAEQIATGELPPEPFYRAPLYSGILSLWFLVGGSAEWLPLVARGLNYLCLLGSAFLVYRLVRVCWGEGVPEWTAPLAGLLYGVYPVAWFFAGDPLDVTLAIFFFLGALHELLRPDRSWKTEVRGGLLLGLAILTRPHFLVLLPLLALRLWPGRKLRLEALGAIGGAGTCLLLMGWINYFVGGEFRPTPWQGSFNLWAANRVGSTGTFFSQRYEVPLERTYRNPARQEGEWAYGLATGKKPPYAISEMNGWFRGQLVQEFREDPGSIIGVMGRKTLALLYHHEQYNNKTYRFHAERALLLKWNPLGWSWVLMLAGCSLVVHGLGFGRSLGSLWLAVAVFTAGVLVFYASARFRLPLVAPLLVIGAGTAGLAVSGSGRWPSLWKTGFLIPLLALTLIDFGRVDQSIRTTLEDRLLVAAAALESGQPDVAELEAAKVLEVLPTRRNALLLAITGGYENDLLATAASGVLPNQARAAIQLERLAKIGKDLEAFDEVRLMYGLLLNSTSDPRAAWKRAVQQYIEQRDALGR